MQGFQTPIANDSFIVDGVGALGTAHTERGLTFLEVALSGHMCVFLVNLYIPKPDEFLNRVPQYSPVVRTSSLELNQFAHHFTGCVSKYAILDGNESHSIE